MRRRVERDLTAAMRSVVAQFQARPRVRGFVQRRGKDKGQIPLEAGEQIGSHAAGCCEGGRALSIPARRERAIHLVLEFM